MALSGNFKKKCRLLSFIVAGYNVAGYTIFNSYYINFIQYFFIKLRMKITKNWGGFVMKYSKK
jgi:hypothetical protein